MRDTIDFGSLVKLREGWERFATTVTHACARVRARTCAGTLVKPSQPSQYLKQTILSLCRSMAFEHGRLFRNQFIGLPQPPSISRSPRWHAQVRPASESPRDRETFWEIPRRSMLPQITVGKLPGVSPPLRPTLGQIALGLISLFPCRRRTTAIAARVWHLEFGLRLDSRAARAGRGIGGSFLCDPLPSDRLGSPKKTAAKFAEFVFFLHCEWCWR